MHVVFRERHGLEESDSPADPGQTPADLAVLSYSDSELASFAAAHRGGPSLLLANLSLLRHPLSVDHYLDVTLSGARAVLVRLIGGAAYWDYGLAQLSRLARARGIALAVLPADGRPDAALEAASTLPAPLLDRLRKLCETGGTAAAGQALALLAGAAGLSYPTAPAPDAELPLAGAWDRQAGCAACPAAFHLQASRPRVVMVFYRAWAAAGDLAALDALAAELDAQGFDVIGLYVPSLKAAEARAFVRRWLEHLAPRIVVSATGFSARDAAEAPLDCGVPVVQIAHATSDRAAWAGAERGLSPADLAMHVVLPEIDGHIFGGVVSFKEQAARSEALQFAPARHAPEPARIRATAARIAALARLGSLAPAERRLAMVLSSYPGKPWQIAHAVGLDALASAQAIAAMLAEAGYDVQPPDMEALHEAEIGFGLADYRAAFARLPDALQQSVTAAWGAPEDDPDCRGGAFRFRAIWAGRLLIAAQPERGRSDARAEDYHDLSRQPRHAYVAFYLWLQTRADALIHLGAHGTLEWLPGKAVALSDACWPEALTGPLPVVYPFIANDPGEAAQAKRRLGAVTLGHLPPPLVTAGRAAGLGQLEALLDEFATADGLDPRRRDRLQEDIRAEATALGLEAELGLAPDTEAAEAITRLDSFVCDVKDSRFGDGLHIYGAGECGAAERAGLLAALDARFVAAGPSGSPARGRSDVKPTGRNLFAVDPRAVPTRAAFAQGQRLAAELIRRHLQDHGDYPRGLVVDLWGSATMRTAGEEFAMALSLIGAKPVWDESSGRVSGVEIVPVTELDYPRLDVTLRVSGLFRDAFPTLPQLFAQAVRALSARDEAADWNPYAGQAQGARVFGPAPGSYGAGMGDPSADLSDDARARAGRAWLAASSHALDLGRADEAGLRARVAVADAFVHAQDLPESDLLLAADYAAHEAGFAAAQGVTGGQAAIWHLDATDPARPRARSLPEEVARITRARAANPDWLSGMMRHSFRGAAEIAATLDHMAAFAHLADAVSDAAFDLYYDATLGDAAIRAFLERENPAALAAMQAQFAALRAAGLWVTRRNSIAAAMDGDAA
ncbi:MAG: cobaltochelatase subunit CobN [Paracoccus sp. (in: a-proteobacteria)]|nr:cobaltochelatase subunit CobN [Paracoccus sp. (in: a-proteobacteria)]